MEIVSAKERSPERKETELGQLGKHSRKKTKDKIGRGKQRTQNEDAKKRDVKKREEKEEEDKEQKKILFLLFYKLWK